MRTLPILSFLLIVGSLAISNGEAPASSEKTMFIPHDAVMNLMIDAIDSVEKSRTNFASARNPLDGNANREGMKEFVAYKMSQAVGAAGGKQEGHELKRDTFRTQILNNQNQPVAVDATNVIAILKGTNSGKKDKPLMILANYDTDIRDLREFNPVEDNGAGVAAMLVLLEFVANEMAAKAYKLENTLIFAATDVSFRRYANSQEANIPPNATTGSDRLAQDFLPGFLGDREFRGAIVLDNILNFNAEQHTQSALSFSKPYPAAYQLMSSDNFAGNFLGLVSRPTDLDQNLKKKVQQGWDKAHKQPKEEGLSALSNIEPKLIVFEHVAEDESSEAFLYFLQSDQYSFWNHHLRSSPSYPAVLLTDTGKYRKAICNTCSKIEDSTTPENLAFAHRTILTLYNVVKDLQTSAGSGANSGRIPAGIAMIATFMAVFLRAIY